MVEIAHPVTMRVTPTETMTVGGGSFTHFSESNMGFRAYASSATDGTTVYFSKAVFSAEL